MKTKLWLAAGLIIVGYILASTMITVKETDLVIVTQFGKPVRSIAQAGLAFKLPDPVETVVRLDKRQQLLSLEPAEFVTRDRRNLVVNAFVVWRISNPEIFIASVRNSTTAELRLETLTNSEIGAAIGGRSLNDIFTVVQEEQKMSEIFSAVTTSANQIAMRELGVEIVAVHPNRFGFPKQNLLAIYKRMESERDRIAKQYRAEGQEEAAKIRAETEREVRELQAQANREAQKLKGESEAEAARIYAKSFETSPNYYKFVRSMEAYEKMLGKETRFIFSTDSPMFEYLMSPPEMSK
ncbi:Modulator of FtsH protease HflC [Thalassocella blandensis]|nr:Modulator of FtsH protease HflC [Thalassocella blandensis]